MYGSDSVVEYVRPDKGLDSVVKGGPTMCHKESDVLQEDRDFDCDYNRTVDD